jgi:hypothetical protein
MKKSASEKILKRLRMANSEYNNLKNARDFEQFEEIWYKVLVCGNAVDMILETSMKVGKEQPWYGVKIKLRREDPLLSYMHAARNVDEHGLEPVIVEEPGALVIGVGGESVHLKSLRIVNGKIEFLDAEQPDGSAPTILQIPRRPKLVSVFDVRSKKNFDPPIQHLGKIIDDTSPVGVAKVWIGYLNSVVNEAQRFVSEN